MRLKQVSLNNDMGPSPGNEILERFHVTLLLLMLRVLLKVNAILLVIRVDHTFTKPPTKIFGVTVNNLGLSLMVIA